MAAMDPHCMTWIHNSRVLICSLQKKSETFAGLHTTAQKERNAMHENTALSFHVAEQQAWD